MPSKYDVGNHLTLEVLSDVIMFLNFENLSIFVLKVENMQNRLSDVYFVIVVAYVCCC